jgi:hypothetical protein
MKKTMALHGVPFKDKLQASHRREYEGLTAEQRRWRRARKLATSQSPIAKLWRSVQAKDKKAAETLETVLEGIEDARAGRFAKPPNLRPRRRRDQGPGHQTHP